MAWYWSDDVARAAIDAGLVPESVVTEWLHRPFGIAADADLELIDLARRQFGIETSESVGAA